MSHHKEVFIVSGARTPIGKFGGSLKDYAPHELASITTKSCIERAKIDPSHIGACILGHVLPTEARDIYISRVAAINGGLSKSSIAFGVNRLCGSGLHAIYLACQGIWSGDYELAIAGGAESMTRSGYLLPQVRWGQRMGDAQAIDLMTAALNDPFNRVHMGITAENLAKKYHISREAQDQFALTSHHRAQNALDQGYFKDQITPVNIRIKKQQVAFTLDEHVRSPLCMDDIKGLKPAFDPEGTVTSANASGLNDAAATLLFASGEAVKQHNLSPLARVIGFGHAGVEPMEMGIGPVPAVQNLLKATGTHLSSIDVTESNEAFAVQAMAVAQELHLDPNKTNPNGGAVALGHPIGATGGIIMIKAIYELIRTQKRLGLATMCIGGGQGIAALFERC